MFLEIFPTLIAVHENILEVNYLNEVKKACSNIEKKIKKTQNNWFSPVFNTYELYNLIEDNLFNELISKVTQKTNEYNELMGSSEEMHPFECWFNTYYNKDYQEFHIHQNSIYSAVFFVEAPKNSSPLILQNPNYLYKMFVLNNFKDSKYSFNTWSIPSEENKLVIFPSHLLHMVPCHQSNKKRVSIAINFKHNV